MNKLHNLLIKNGLTIAVAESCTGGLISKILTDIPGSSKYFKLGIIAYSNKMKRRLLKIPAYILNSKGAVSKEAASLMAKNVRKIVNTDIGIGITGIAGPSGGTKIKPVGLVYIAVSKKKKTLVKKFNFKGSRNQIRKKAALNAINFIAKLLNC